MLVAPSAKYHVGDVPADAALERAAVDGIAPGHLPRGRDRLVRLDQRRDALSGAGQGRR